jgi:hypothetical protein
MSGRNPEIGVPIVAAFPPSKIMGGQLDKARPEGDRQARTLTDACLIPLPRFGTVGDQLAYVVRCREPRHHEIGDRGRLAAVTD